MSYRKNIKTIGIKKVQININQKLTIMKKFLLGSIAFFLFSISISILQTSCDKDADAENSSFEDFNPIKKILYYKEAASKVTGIWVCNYDGTGHIKVNLSLPNGIVFPDPSEFLFLSADGKKIFFTAGPDAGLGFSVKTDIYSCNLDGSNLTKIVTGDDSFIVIGDVK